MIKRRKNQESQGSMIEHSRLENNWIDYDHFWSTIRDRYGLKEEMKIALWKFFEATGNTNPINFDEGLKKFGIKDQS